MMSIYLFILGIISLFVWYLVKLHMILQDRVSRLERRLANIQATATVDAGRHGSPHTHYIYIEAEDPHA